MTRKTLNQVYQEKYGKTWGLNDVEKCTFDYKEVITNDLVKLLFSLTSNPDWVFAGNHHLNKLNQIVYSIRNELFYRKNENTQPPQQVNVDVMDRRPHYETEINYNK
jgi:hypothetical protein